MVSVELARALREAGLRWSPRRGDHFVVADRGMDDEVFVLSDMTIEVHEFPTGPVIGFNGTVEWALDSLDKRDALWLPSEHQLRELLGRAFLRLERSDASYVVVARVDGGESEVRAGDAAEAYGLALLELLRSLATDPVP
jgi:hypothetical protein